MGINNPRDLYINLRSRDSLLLWLFDCACVRVCVCACVRACVRLGVYVRYSLHSVRFGQLLHCAHKRIVNMMKVYVCESRNSMQYRSPNKILEISKCQTVYIVIRLNTIGYTTARRDFVHSIGAALSLVTQIHY